MHSPGPGFVVLYRWRLHEGSEESFVTAWSRVSDLLLSERGSLGSRLHRGPDGLWYSCAEWPSLEAREKAFRLGPGQPGPRPQMADTISSRPKRRWRRAVRTSSKVRAPASQAKAAISSRAKAPPSNSSWA